MSFEKKKTQHMIFFWSLRYEYYLRYIQYKTSKISIASLEKTAFFYIGRFNWHGRGVAPSLTNMEQTLPFINFRWSLDTCPILCMASIHYLLSVCLYHDLHLAGPFLVTQLTPTTSQPPWWRSVPAFLSQRKALTTSALFSITSCLLKPSSKAITINMDIA